MAVTLFPSPQKMNSMMSRIFIKDISGLEGLMKQLKETGLGVTEKTGRKNTEIGMSQMACKAKTV